MLCNQNKLCELITFFGSLIQTLTGVVASLALLVFFWGLVKYIASSDDEKAKDAGKRIMVGGVIGLFVMFSVFGLVRFMQSAFGLQGDNNPQTMTPPNIEFGGN